MCANTRVGGGQQASDRFYPNSGDYKVVRKEKPYVDKRPMTALELACRKAWNDHSPKEFKKLLRSKKRPDYLEHVILRAFYYKLDILFKHNRQYLEILREPKFFTKKALLDPLIYYLFDEYLSKRNKSSQPKARRVEPVLETISRNYNPRDFIYELSNTTVMNKDILDSFMKYARATELEKILPENYFNNPQKAITKKQMTDAIVFKLFTDCMAGRRETDQRVKGVLDAINKYKKLPDFIFRLKDKTFMPKSLHKEFLKFYNFKD